MQNNGIANTVDTFALLDAEYKSVKKRYEKARDAMIALGVGEHVSEFYAVTYYTKTPVKTFDKDRAKEHLAALGLTKEQIEETFGFVKIGKAPDCFDVKAAPLSHVA